MEFYIRDFHADKTKQYKRHQKDKDIFIQQIINF